MTFQTGYRIQNIMNLVHKCDIKKVNSLNYKVESYFRNFGRSALTRKSAVTMVLAS